MSTPKAKPFSAPFKQVCCASLLAAVVAVPAAAFQAKAPAKPSGKMEVAISAQPPVKQTIDAVCRKDDFQPEVLQIEGKGANLFLRFTIIDAKKGTHPIVMEGLTSPKGAHARFDVLSIDRQNYSVPSGDVTLSDDTGRAGTLRAKRFTKNGSRGETATFTLDAVWKCS